MAFRTTFARLAPQKLDKWFLRQYRDPEVRKYLGLKTAYRGRGAFTLLQLNQNNERFLDKKHITAVIDLGAHPGTWSQVVEGKLGWCPEPPKARRNTHTSVLLSSTASTQPMATEPQEEALTLDTSAVAERKDNPHLPPPLFFKPDIIHAATMEPASSVAAGSSKLGMESNDFSTPKPLGKGHGTVIAVDTKKIKSIRGVQTVQLDWTLPETSTLIEGLLAGVNKQGKADVILSDCTVQTYDEFVEDPVPTILHCKKLFEFARRHLVSGRTVGQLRGGVLLFKAFQHPRMFRFRVEYLRPNFGSVYFIQAQSRRLDEHEGYFLCQGWDLKKVPYPSITLHRYASSAESRTSPGTSTYDTSVG
ncbi:hypothetical protein NLJ89_g3453 [Agrocybe chaxingu]|uniref:rRNA methyltransferase 2, mitochondrial n=1 Tax=Agrocybe chaxingu TaxID=84603 RepID=A0A9W8KB16_9AGAR|nr:hypothetical protein NLJ89_g3453 [Agrocybe chaxingu]